jgi:hypothetical protein
VDRYLRASTRGVAAITFVLGVVMMVMALSRGGGPFAVGVVGGVAFMVLGAIRFAGAARRQT